ncbi:MAG: ABC transporter permease, partial [Holophagales bacterium]|nr:ABC transporter permease [Holophagales bacterium]
TPGYLETAGIELLRGRDLDRRDGADSERVVLVNQALARRLEQEGRDPLGASLTVFFEEEIGVRVVGVVGNTRFAGLDQPLRPAVFFVHPQLPFMGMSIVARTDLGSAAFGDALAAAVLAVDASQPPGSVYSVEAQLARLLGGERFVSRLLSLFSATALLLAAIGLYGILSYWVRERVREIGVRMALGASSRATLAWVLGRAARLAILGILPGFAGAFVLAGVLRASFQGVGSLGAPGLLGLGLGILLVALAAAWWPARRASHIAPVEALRSR